MGWKDMDVAPMDGTRILVYGISSKGVYPACIRYENGAWIICKTLDGYSVVMDYPLYWTEIPEGLGGADENVDTGANSPAR